MNSQNQNRDFHKPLVMGLMGSLGFIFLFLAIFLPPNSDDAALTNYAIYGKIKLLEYFHPYPLDYCFSYVSLWNGLFWIIRHMTELFGISPTVVRMPIFLFSIANVGILLTLFQKLNFSALSKIGIFFACLSPAYLITTAEVRTEQMIFLIALVNLLWLFFYKQRFLGFLSGLLMALALSSYPTALFFLSALSLFLLWKHRSKFFAENYAWWLGIGCGLVADLYIINFEEIIIFSKINWMVYGSSLMQAPAVLRYCGDVFNILYFTIRLVTKAMSLQYAFPFNRWAMNAFLLTMFLQVRYFKKLEPLQKDIFVFMGFFLFCYGSMTGSFTSRYLLFYWPILLGYSIHFLRNFWKEPGFLSLEDVLIISIGLFYTGWIGNPFGWDFFFFLCLTFRLLCGSWTALSHTTRWAIVISLAVVFLDVEIFVRLSELLKDTRPLHLGILFAAVTLPWLLIKFDGSHLLIRGLRYEPTKKLFVVFCATLLFVDGVHKVITSGRATVDRFRHDLYQPSFLAKYAQQKRVVGPMELWLYNPKIELQATDEFFDLKAAGFGVKTADRIYSFNPSLVVLPVADIKLLEKEVLHSRKFRLQRGQLYQTTNYPDFSYQEITLTKIGQ